MYLNVYVHVHVFLCKEVSFMIQIIVFLLVETPTLQLPSIDFHILWS